VWHEYIVWVEQTGRREGNLQTLLEKCIKELKDDPRYTQDGRFMDVWAKYANTTDDPIQGLKSIEFHHTLIRIFNICSSL